MHLRQKLLLQKIQGNITHRNENLEKKYICRAGQLNFMHRKFKPKRSGKPREMKPSSRSFIHSIICGKTFSTLKCMCIIASFRWAYFVLFPYQATNMKRIFFVAFLHTSLVLQYWFVWWFGILYFKFSIINDVTEHLNEVINLAKETDLPEQMNLGMILILSVLYIHCQPQYKYLDVLLRKY